MGHTGGGAAKLHPMSSHASFLGNQWLLNGERPQPKSTEKRIHNSSCFSIPLPNLLLQVGNNLLVGGCCGLIFFKPDLYLEK